MRRIPILLAATVFIFASTQAKGATADELADLFDAISNIAEDRWTLSYAADSRSIVLKSKAKVSGSDFSRSFPVDHIDDYPIRVVLRLTEPLSEDRSNRLLTLNAKIEDHVPSMSANALAKAGLSKGNPQTLTREEWKQYVIYAELRRQADALAPPTYSFKSLNFVDDSHWHVHTSADQSEQAQRALKDRTLILSIFSKF